MALPKPKKEESESQFVSRFMKSQSARQDYRNRDERLIIASDIWESEHPTINENQYANLVMNFVNNMVRTDTLEGRECWVVNMVMITEGVHAGSNGALYYSAEELKKSASAWDSKPIVVDHPTPVSYTHLDAADE